MRHVSSIIAPSQWLFYARRRIWRKKISIGVAHAHTRGSLATFLITIPAAVVTMDEGREGGGGSFRSGPTWRTRRTTAASSCATFYRGHRLLLSQIRPLRRGRRITSTLGATLSGGSIIAWGINYPSDKSNISAMLRVIEHLLDLETRT